MGMNSQISWTDHTFNPWIGCTKVSPACKNCYAERDMGHRFGRVQWGPTGTRVLTSESNWQKPINWNRTAKTHGIRYRVFCASLADVFEDWRGPIVDNKGCRLFWSHSRQPHESKYHWVSESETAGIEMPVHMHDVRARLFDLIDATPNLDWLLLTKRPEKIPVFWRIHPSGIHQEDMSFSEAYRRDNVFLGVSVENQEYANKRIPELLKCRELSPVLFLSCEPLVGPVDLTSLWSGRYEWRDSLNGIHVGHNFQRSCSTIDWVITGGESGPNARPAEPAWYRSIRDQCSAAEIPFHFKQWGEWIPYEHCGSPPLIESQHGDTYDTHHLPIDLVDHEPVDNWYWPDGLSETVYRRVGKKSAGRMLDGVEHNEYPRALSQKGIK